MYIPCLVLNHQFSFIVLRSNPKFLIGGYYYERKVPSTTFDSILRYDPNKESWEEEGQMMEARESHTVSVLEDVSLLCP